MSITQDEIKAAKGRGFLLNRGTDNFSGRVVCRGGVFSASQLSCIAECAEKLGGGKVSFTSRLSAEIAGIPYDKLDQASEFLAKEGLTFGGTGPKVRPITACKGTTCVFGNIDTQRIAELLHDRFYVELGSVKLPHKFKIGVGGCPNSCMKPSLNDVGFEGRRVKGEPYVAVYVGGTWGRTRKEGILLGELFEIDKISELTERILLWYRDNGFVGERFAKTIERLGFERFERELFSEELWLRRSEILNAPLKEKC